MTEQQQLHPAPTKELRRQWRNQWHESEVKPALFPDWMNICIAQWGADQELEACRQWLEINGAPRKFIDGLLAARRPKPPSLKEQALAELVEWERIMDIAPDSPIRRALELLDD
jgi:hypothetical protein